MKHSCHRAALAVCSTVLLLTVTLTAQVQEGKELIRLDMHKAVSDVAVNPNVATTITFPDKITLMTGFGLIKDPGEEKSLGQTKVALVHYDNVMADTLVVRLVRPGEPCHATIRAGNHLYLMRFVPSESANLAVIVPPPLEHSAATATTADEVVAQRLQFDADELVGILSKAKARKALQPLNPTLYTGWEERNDLNMSTTVDGLTTTIYEIQRWTEKDANVFRCWITNTSTNTFEFEPMGVKIRVGERSYPAQLADCSGVVMPNQKVPLDVVLQGNVGGGREYLSIKQDFRVELPPPGRTEMSPVLFGSAGAPGDANLK
jgi:hypothetical protein